MKIKGFNSILSCILKSIRFLTMINKKIVFSLFCLFLLNNCAQNSMSLLGPAYSLGSSGNVYQAGFSYASNEAINKITGKTTGENVKELLQPNKNDNELKKFLKARIIETRKKLNFKNTKLLP